MIKINLLPKDLQKNTSKTGGGFNKLLYLVPLGFLILLVIHGYLASVNLSLGLKLSTLNSKWKGLAPQKKELEALKSKVTLLTQDSSVMTQLLKDRINWAEKLNLLSLKLSSGIWFNEISVSKKEFLLKGSVISLEKQELTLINKFLNSLKEDAQFNKDFVKLELGPAERESIGGYDIINFTLNGTIR